MLQITIPAGTLWDEGIEEFISTKEKTLQLEHSLVSLSKWESKWHKPFLSDKEKTFEETIDYIRCMTITQNVKPEVYLFLTKENVDQIYEYINDPMTATTFNDLDNTFNREVITSEIIYYWMISLNIPIEFQKWHLNKLITLIKVISLKNAPKKKISKQAYMEQMSRLNDARRKEWNTKG